MKDSGIEWIGEIPKDWKIARIKDLTTEENTLFLDGDWIDSYNITDEGIRYLTTGNIGEGYFKEQGNGYISQNTFDKLKCLAVYPNDLAISRLNIPLGRSCIIPNSFEKYIVAVDVTILRCDSSYYKRYLMYCMNVPSYNEMAKLIARGTTMLRLSRTLLGTLQLPIPPYQLQKQIANFLDDKCADIDQLITLQQQMIDELKAYKQSVITEAVCKGLDKSVPMKDSGIEWIGEVPEGWKIRKVKTLSIMINGYAFDSQKFGLNNKNKVLRIGDIFDGVINREITTNIDDVIELEKYILQENDIVIALSGATVGKIGYVNNLNNEKIYVNQRVGIIRADNHKLLFYFLQSNVFRKYVELLSWGSAQPNISLNQIGEFKIPFSVSDGLSIVSYLDQKCSQIDTLISIKQQKIDELKEYKKSMIYEHITGKKQVPN